MAVYYVKEVAALHGDHYTHIQLYLQYNDIVLLLYLEMMNNMRHVLVLC